MMNTGRQQPPLDFDRRLALALRTYAGELPVDVDHLAIAGAAAAAAQSRPRGWPGTVRVWPRGLRLALAAALLLGGAIVGLALVGAFRDRTQTISATPEELRGAWQSVTEPGISNTDATFHLNFGWELLLRDWEGIPQEWAGRAVDIRPTAGSRSWTIEIAAPAPCGNASYRAELTSPDALLSFAVVDDACQERSRRLTYSVWGSGSLVPGEIHEMPGFSEPFSFVGPRNDINGGMPSIREANEPGLLELGGPESWDGRFVDDARRYSDPCDATSPLEDSPATPEGIGIWLQDTPGVVVEQSTEIPVDGRTATFFHLGLEAVEDCPTAWLVTANGREVFLTDLVYVVPTGDDTILFLASTLNNPFGPTERQATDVVRTMRFDQP